jgi:hypothetical protein
MITIPYILNKNEQYNQSKLTNYYFENYTSCEILNEKKFDVGFFGSIDKNRTSNLFYSRQFLLLLFERKLNFKFINEDGNKAEELIPKCKYNFVLRGDTPTRLSFFQCFTFGCVPILYAKDAQLYSNLLLLAMKNKNSNDF